MNIILFGPPGIGKSTMIGILKMAKHHAIDLEDVFPSKIRFQLPNQINNAFIGAADLNPRRAYPNSIKVLLYMDQTNYEQRRAHRDAEQPEKSKQTGQMVDDWLKGTHYQLVLDVTDSNYALKELTKLANLYFKKEGD